MIEMLIPFACGIVGGYVIGREYIAQKMFRAATAIFNRSQLVSDEAKAALRRGDVDEFNRLRQEFDYLAREHAAFAEPLMKL